MRRHKWLSSFVFFSASLAALPQDPSTVHGQVQVKELSTAYLDIRAGDKAIIEWKSFSIAQGETVFFRQPYASAAVLNRVASGIKSEIFGRMQATGHVYLINPAGILIGREGLIQTAGFLASTLDLPNDEFITGKNLRFQGSEGGSVINLGTIESSDDVYLLGSNVANRGKIIAEKAHVFLGAGREILLQADPDLPLYIRPCLDDEASSSLENDGLIRAIRTELIAAGRPQSVAISHTGHIDALNIQSREGKIFLRADQGEITSTGKLEAKESIDISADTLHLQKTSITSSPQGRVNLQSYKMFSHAGRVSATAVDVHVTTESPFIHTGSIEAVETIAIQAPKFLNAGLLKTNPGGKISIDIQESSIETTSATLSASCGTITHHAAALLSSGRYDVGTIDRRRAAGEVEIFAPRMRLIGAHLSAVAPLKPGKITLGKTALHAGTATDLFLGYTTRLESDHIDLAPSAFWQENLQSGLCSTDPGTACVFSSIGEFINPDPTSSGFGHQVFPLSTGNVVITNPTDNFAASSAGAAYLFNGMTGALISALTGSSASDQVSSRGITALTGNGNYVVSSFLWNSNRGAATWGNGSTGVSGTVSSSNSLVGSSAGDFVSRDGITILTNGNYVVSSSQWNSNLGAATWGNGSTGIAGTISSGNSLVGSAGGDQISSSGIAALTNGNYVVASVHWNSDTGAATWGNGSTGITGTISSTNSLVGSLTDFVSGNGITALTNGNYVVASTQWNSDTGAATWGDGSTGTFGTVSSSNSITGANPGDDVALDITPLTNGNYVVSSFLWNSNTGAATWATGSSATSSVVSGANSIIGASSGDSISDRGIFALTNGNYVIASSAWNSNRGAATWGDGTMATSTFVSIGNSLVGSTAGDFVADFGIIPLTNGNYVVSSESWSSGMGAVTWGNGTTGTSGSVSSVNSLVGSMANDFVGEEIFALSNGNYVVGSSLWNSDVGAATWGNGTTGTSGVVSSVNSLVGSLTGDFVGEGVSALTNGDYVVNSPGWNSSEGASTWGNGTAGTFGTVSIANSIVGSQSGDFVGGAGTFFPIPVVEIPSACYAVVSPDWNGSAGAVTPASSIGETTGTVTSQSSFVGTGTSTGLSGVVYNSAAGSLIMPFTTEGNGRVFFTNLRVPIVVVPVHVHVPSYGLVDFRIPLSEMFQNWGPYFLGGVLNEDDYAPYLSYKQVEPRLFPSLIKRPLENQRKLLLKSAPSKRGYSLRI